MQNKITNLLSKSPRLKAREIAKQLGVDRTEVNAYLYKNKDYFSVDSEHRWSIKSSGLEVTLPAIWVSGAVFEQTLKKCGSPLDATVSNVRFIVPEGCSIFLEAAARLLALCNQLVEQKKSAEIDFSAARSTFGYFVRMGFFDCLDSRVVVLPKRPKTSIHKGSNDSLVEFGVIDPDNPDENIPKLLKNSFVTHAGAEYSSSAFTVISELFGNVRDHSKAPIPGYVALQYYKGYGKSKPARIQTVISDSGKGIVGTLRPILKTRYPEIAERLDFSDPKCEPLLVKEVFEKGRISRSSQEGRGLGLKRAADVAAKYNAEISVRQERFELRLKYKNGKMVDSAYILELPKLNGTHICFDLLPNVQ